MSAKTPSDKPDDTEQRISDRKKTKEVIAALKDKYSDTRHWACASEVSRSTGYMKRRIDFVAMSCFESECFCIDAFEVKVSKQDLMKELQMTQKHAVFFDTIDRYTLVVPSELASFALESAPEKWGIMVYKNGMLRYRRKPLTLHDEKRSDIDRGFIASFLRRAIMPASIANSEMRSRAYQEGFEVGKRLSPGADAEREIDELKSDIKCYEYMTGIMRSDAISTWAFDDMVRVFKAISPRDFYDLMGKIKSMKNLLNETELPEPPKK